MRCALFGATGFLGSHVAEELAGSPHAVTACVRVTSNTAMLDASSIRTVRIDFENHAHIESAITAIERPQEPAAKAALEAFVRLVGNYAAAGTLSAAEEQSLRSAALAVGGEL